MEARLQGMCRANTTQLLPQQAKALHNQNQRLLNVFVFISNFYKMQHLSLTWLVCTHRAAGPPELAWLGG